MLLSFFQYNRWANSLIINELVNFERIEKIEHLFSHILNAHRIWNSRAVGESPFVLPFDLVGKTLWDKIDHDNYLDSIKILSKVQHGTEVAYHNTQKEHFNILLEDLFLHIINHSTHHRGQIVSLIRESGHVPPVTDFIAWQRAGKPVIE